MLRRWCIPLTGLGVVLGLVATAGTAAAAPAAHHAAVTHVIRPAVHLVRPVPHGTRPLTAHAGPVTHATSANWSGYAATGRTYTSVSATWTEPAGYCGGSAEYSSFWVGLDGYGSSTAEQAGSEVDCSGTTPRYYAWYELYPEPPVNFSDPVSPGDRFYGSVTYNGSGRYTLVLQDLTKGWSHTVSATLNGAANASAEVIAEAPCCTASGGTLPLAHFSPDVPFSNATANGSPIGNFSPTEIMMANNSGQAMDSVSALSGGNAFTVTWLRSS